MASNAVGLLVSAATFLTAAWRYWLDVFPSVQREQRRWATHAGAIPDPALRRAAMEAHKRRNREGAAAFATLAPAHERAILVEVLVAFQTMSDYLDTISERPGASSPANARQLHRAVSAALGRGGPEPDYYALDPACDDGGYLRDLVAACRHACASLPSYPAVADRTSRFAEFYAAYQTIIGVGPMRIDAAADWVYDHPGVQPGLRWWEIAAAAGSTLPVLALLAAAADPSTRSGDVAAIERAYFPWISAFHSLLDSLIDQTEDALAGHHSLINHYASAQETADRLSQLARRSVHLAQELPDGRFHVAILRAMASFYLSDPEASRPEARYVRQAVLTALGGATAPPLLIFRIRRLATFLARLLQVCRALAWP